MSDCECGAHYLQNCSWWCGRGLTSKQVWEYENPKAVQLEELTIEVRGLKKALEKLKERGREE